MSKLTISSNLKQRVKSKDDLIEVMQKQLLFPLLEENPFICGAATLVYNKSDNVMYICIPYYPLYYGYKMFLEINEKQTYDVIFNPNIEKIFATNLDIWQKINFISLPYELTERCLLDSECNKSIIEWLKGTSVSSSSLSKEAIAHIHQQSGHLDYLEFNKLIVDFLHNKYSEYLQLKEDKLLQSFTEKLNKTKYFDCLINVLKDDETKLLYNKDAEINSTIFLIDTLKTECTLFLEEIELLALKNMNGNINDGEFECNMLRMCEIKYNSCSNSLEEMKERINSFIMSKIKTIFHNEPVWIIYDQMISSYNNPNYPQLILHNLESLQKTHKNMFNFIKSRNNYKLKELANIVNDYKLMFKNLTDNTVDISSYRIREFYDFVQFHENAIHVYPDMQSDTISETIVNRSSREMAYCQAINILQNESYLHRNGTLIKNKLKMFLDIFDIEDKNLKITDLFQNGLDIFPETFWDLTDDMLDILNRIMENIAFFTGQKLKCSFTAKFPTDYQTGKHFLLKNIGDFTLFLNNIETFTIANPSDLTNYSFSVIPNTLNIKCVNDSNQKYFKSYYQEWIKLVKEYNKYNEQLQKAKDVFDKTIKHFLQLDVCNASLVYKEICNKVHEKWPNIIHYLAQIENNPHHDFFYLLDQLEQKHSDHLRLVLSTCTTFFKQSITEIDAATERRKIVANIVGLGFKQLYDGLLTNILDDVEKMLDHENKKWHDAEKIKGVLWSEDFLFYASENGCQEKKHIIPYKKVINEKYLFLLNLLKCTSDSKEMLIQDIHTIINSSLTPTWKFGKIISSNTTLPVKKLTKEFDNSITTYDEVTCLQNEHEVDLIKTISYYLALFIIEIFFQFEPNFLLKVIKNNTLKEELRHINIIYIVEHILQKYPCYGLIEIIDLNEPLVSSTMTLKEQITIHRKITLFTIDGTSIKKSNNKPILSKDVPFKDFLDICKEQMKNKKLNLSSTCFATLVSENYWKETFVSDLQALQNVWSESRKGFCLRSTKKSSKGFKQLAVASIKYIEAINLFKCDIIQKFKGIKHLSLINNSLPFNSIGQNKSESQKTTDDQETSNSEHNFSTTKDTNDGNLCLSNQYSHSSNDNLVDNLLTTLSNLTIHDSQLQNNEDNDPIEEEQYSDCCSSGDDDKSSTNSILCHGNSSTKLKQSNDNKNSIHTETKVIFNTSNFNAHCDIIRQIGLFQNYLDTVISQYNQRKHP